MRGEREDGDGKGCVESMMRRLWGVAEDFWKMMMTATRATAVIIGPVIEATGSNR